MKIPFFTLRHGQTDWNLHERLQGHTDIPLNDNGRAQARDAALLLQNKGITRIVASPLLRARETAEIVAGALSLPITLDKRIVECNYGVLEGMTNDEIESHPEKHKLFIDMGNDEFGHWHAVDGEGREAIDSRVWSCIDEHHTAHPQHVHLFVFHGGCHRAIFRRLFGKSERSANAVPHFYEPDGDAYKVTVISR